MKMSIHTLRKRFVKDESLPIGVLQDPYFDYFLDLFNPLYGCKENYQIFLHEVERAGGEEEFLKSYYDIRDKIISDVKENPHFMKFNEDKLKEYEVENNIRKDDVYRPENNGKVFFSIDLKKANFHSLKFYHSEIFGDYSSYEDWISTYTDSEYMKTSKYLRQVIFGNLNPKKQVKIEKFITSKFLEAVLEIIPIEYVRSVSHDELVILSPENFDVSLLEKKIKEKSENLDVPARMEVFKLVKQAEKKELGYVKESLNGDKPVFKSVPGIFMPQAYKYYFKLPLHDYDLVFFHEGHLVSFLSPISDSE